MIFSRIPGHRLRHAMVSLVALAGLTACGGGTSQYDPFIAQRVIAFGDETSALTSTGQNYSINGTTSSDDGFGNLAYTVNCNGNPIWVQSLAGFYGFVFAECNTSNNPSTQAVMRAQAGAEVADIQVQIDAQIAAGGFRDKDLVSMLAGANDIIELYQQFPGRSEEDLTVELRARGKQLALQVNRLVDFGTKVIVATVPDMGLTPYARKQQLEFDDTDRAAMLSRLTAAFNEGLGVNIVLDGRYVGLVQADLRTQAMVRSPLSFGLNNVSSGACLATAELPDCTTQTLADGATATTWMWADDLHLSYAGHAQLASLAVDRARRNPF